MVQYYFENGYLAADWNSEVTTKNSYVKILRTSTIMGGVAAIGFLLTMLRVKFAAISLGASGVGLLTSFLAVQSLITALIGLGLQSSATRAIADALAQQDLPTVSSIVQVLRALSWLSGLTGFGLMVTFSESISRLTFGNGDHECEIASLGFVVLLLNLSAMHVSVIQGLRRIGDMARANTLGLVAGTAMAIVCYVVWGLHGILPSLVLMACVQLLANWHYARGIALPQVDLNWRMALSTCSRLLGVGATFMWNGLLVSGVSYITLAIVTNSAGLGTAGIYGAAIAISNASVGFVLGAMAADYFPQLAATSHDHSAATRAVNEQAEVGLLLSLPCLLAILVFAPWILRFLYANEFVVASALTQLLVFGCLGRVIAWPIGMVLPALGKARWFLYCETLANILHVGLIIVLLPMFGLEGIGLASILLYVGYIAAVYYAAAHLIGFSWSNGYRLLVSRSLFLITFAFVVCRSLPLLPATFIGTLITGIGLFYSIRGILTRLGPDHVLRTTISKIPILEAICKVK